MSNWAAWKEKEIGLPVVKRAKHGIHFDAGKGLVQAEFVGKPCHYFDGKLWQAIDTKPLLRKDGSYGCPHSDVIIHTDGTVQLGEYRQKAALIYPGKISVDGDRIARPFSGGVQYLYITEDGYRQEIVLEKMPDLRKVSALVDTVKGVLPTKYTASSLSLKDSSTAELSDFVQVGSKSLASVLEAAKYPVVIDPDISVNTGVGGDTFIYSDSATYNYGSMNYFAIRNPSFRTLIRFDLSSIDSSNTCTAGTLNIYFTGSETEDTYSLYKISDANGDWIEGTKSGAQAGSGEPCWNAKAADGAGGVTTEWAGSAGLSTAGTDYINTVLASLTVTSDAANTKAEVPFNASGLTILSSWFGDATNNGFLMTCTVNSSRTFHSGEHATESYRPVLSVTYAAAGTFIPVNMMANTQNLTAGMRG